MPQFDTQWLEPTATGAPASLRRARVQAGDAAAVAAVLGVPPAWLLQVQPVRMGWWTGPLRLGAGQRLQLRLFSQELAVLLDAGIPLLEALQTLREKDGDVQAHPDAASPLDAVIAALHDGQPVSAALAQSPRDFDDLFIALVASSERSGQLVATLRDHAAYLAWAQALAGALRAALVYPLLLLAAGGAVILFLLLYVLPRFAGVFDGMGRELPTASRWLIELGLLAGAHPATTIGLALAGPALALLASRSAALRQAVQAALWRSPGLGPRLRLSSVDPQEVDHELRALLEHEPALCPLVFRQARRQRDD